MFCLFLQVATFRVHKHLSLLVNIYSTVDIINNVIKFTDFHIKMFLECYFV